MLSLAQIAEKIRRYNIRQIINSGENDMLDNKIDKKALEDCFKKSEQKKPEQNFQVDLKETLDNIDDKKLYESIINLKQNNNYVE